MQVCWLIGVITSATDPVAVVALLKDLGASKTLGTLIEGESLLNDGSAVVLFVWVRAAIGYDYSAVAPPWMYNGTGGPDFWQSPSQVGTNFVVVVAQMLCFGVVFGLLFGWATRGMLTFVYNDRFIEGTILIVRTHREPYKPIDLSPFVSLQASNHELRRVCRIYAFGWARLL